MDKLKRAVIKQELVDITGDTWEAIILNQFLYWSDRATDFDKFIKEENQRQLQFANLTEDKMLKEQPLLYGWIYKKASELKEEIMSTDSEVTINRKITNLVTKGFLDRRTNPHLRYDRTYQYRINFSKLVTALVKHGYTLEGYKMDLSIYLESLKSLNLQNEDCNNQNEDSKAQIEDLKNQNEDLKNQIEALKAQIDGAIPEITTEITTKTTTDIKTTKGFDYIVNSYTENEELRQAIFDFIKMRKANKKVLTDRALTLILKRLDSLGSSDVMKIDILNQSIANSWQGVFPLKDMNSNSNTKVSRPEKEKTFSNYDQRQYNFDELEKQLLGWPDK